MTRVHIRDISSAATHPLRLAVLRHDTPTKEVDFAEDDWPGAFHLGAFVAGELVAVSTWVPRPYVAAVPHAPSTEEAAWATQAAFQLRGMATLGTHRGAGLGALLLDAGIARAAAGGATLVWANGRDVAQAFYVRHGFRVVGDGFVDATTLLPHHRIVRLIR